MGLPAIQGKGFLVTDGVELQFSKSGTAWARLPLGFRNAKRTEDGKWTHDKEVLVEGVVFGPLAEFLADNVTERQELWVLGELYTEEYEGKLKTKMMVRAAHPAGAPKQKQPVAAARAKSSDDWPF